MSSKLKKIFVGDTGLWIIIFILMLLSVASVFSATSNLAFAQRGNIFGPILKHVGLIIMGLFFCAVFAHIPTAIWRKFAKVGLILGVGLLLYTLLFGLDLNDGKRWIRIFGMTIQPSELARLALINYVAFKLSEETFASKRTFWEIAVSTVIICLLIFKENFSTAALLGFTIIVLCYIGGVHRKLFWKSVLAIAIAGSLGFIFICATPDTTLTKIPGRWVTWKHRLDPMNPFLDKAEREKQLDIDGKDFQRIHANIAIAKGGFHGVGPGKSEARYSLPQPFSDFIYAIIIEEYGLIGGLFVLSMYIILMFRLGHIALRLNLFYPKFLVIGIGIIICTQALLHMMVNVGLVPVTGQTLPFVSKGGTSYVVTSVYFGLILAASREYNEQCEEAFANISDEEFAKVEMGAIPEVTITDSSYYEDQNDHE